LLSSGAEGEIRKPFVARIWQPLYEIEGAKPAVGEWKNELLLAAGSDRRKTARRRW
jgi:hypothetical protein